ncbi:MAG: hypothetical protein QXY10_03040, partial [Candidatus Micrarchaeaceae archaeon]
VGALSLIGFAMLLFGSQTGISACSHKILQQAKYSCYLNAAEQEGNASLCLGLQEPYSTECVIAFAVNASNINACRVIGSNSEINTCIASVGKSTGNASACILAKNQSCVYEIASAKAFSNYSLCNFLTGVNKSICSSVYYFNNAIKEKNSGLCAQVSNDSSLLGSIIEKSTQVQGLGTAGIMYSYYNITPEEYCIIEVANESGNASACKLLQGNAEHLCEGQFAKGITVNSINESICNNLNSSTRQLCISSIGIQKALATDNLSVCMLPKMGNFTNACIASLAEKEKNISMCNLISINFSNIRAACYTTINSSR